MSWQPKLFNFSDGQVTSRVADFLSNGLVSGSASAPYARTYSSFTNAGSNIALDGADYKNQKDTVATDLEDSVTLISENQGPFWANLTDNVATNGNDGISWTSEYEAIIDFGSGNNTVVNRLKITHHYEFSLRQGQYTLFGTNDDPSGSPVWSNLGTSDKVVASLPINHDFDNDVAYRAYKITSIAATDSSGAPYTRPNQFVLERSALATSANTVDVPNMLSGNANIAPASLVVKNSSGTTGGDSDYEIDYDIGSGFQGSFITPTAFKALAKSGFVGISTLILRLRPIGSFGLSTVSINSEGATVEVGQSIVVKVDGVETTRMDSAGIKTTNMPTSDPSDPGRLWSNGGDVQIDS